MNPAAVYEWRLPVLLFGVWTRVCLVGACRESARAGVPRGTLLLGCIDWRSWRIAFVPYSRVGSQLL